MKFLVLAACVCMAVAAPPSNDVDATVLRSENQVAADSFGYSYETSNGIAGQASGSLKKVDDKEVLVQQGSFQYQANDGTPVQISYVADENGFQPQGDSLPTPPPTPEAILRALQYIQEHPYLETVKKA